MDIFHGAIEIDAPAGYCYQRWRDFEALPGVLHNVIQVNHCKDNIWHWVLRGPQGDESHWDLLLSEDIPERQLSWQTLSGPDLDMWVTLRFEEIPEQRCRASINLTLLMPASPLGKILKDLYGVTQTALERNLEDFKAYIERGLEKGERGLEAARPPHATVEEPHRAWSKVSSSFK